MGEITIGKFTYICSAINRKGAANNIVIGKYCSIAEGVVFDSGFGHNTSNISTYPFHTMDSTVKSNVTHKGDIIIGNDVWIGDNVTIMSGVTIGDGAIIGTKSVVTRNIPPYAIACGLPARVVKYRFSKGHISDLLSIKWWDWEDSKVLSEAHLLADTDIRVFLEKHS